MTLSDETIPEVPGDPPYEGNPMTVDPDEASYEVLLEHMDDQHALGAELVGLTREESVSLLRALYVACGTKEIALTLDEERDYRDGWLQIEERYV